MELGAPGCDGPALRCAVGVGPGTQGPRGTGLVEELGDVVVAEAVDDAAAVAAAGDKAEGAQEAQLSGDGGLFHASAKASSPMGHGGCHGAVRIGRRDGVADAWNVALTERRWSQRAGAAVEVEGAGVGPAAQPIPTVTPKMVIRAGSAALHFQSTNPKVVAPTQPTRQCSRTDHRRKRRADQPIGACSGPDARRRWEHAQNFICCCELGARWGLSCRGLPPMFRSSCLHPRSSAS